MTSEIKPFPEFIPKPNTWYKVEFYTQFKSPANFPIDTAQLKMFEGGELVYYAPLNLNDNETTQTQPSA